MSSVPKKADKLSLSLPLSGWAPAWADTRLRLTTSTSLQGSKYGGYASNRQTPPQQHRYQWRPLVLSLVFSTNVPALSHPECHKLFCHAINQIPNHHTHSLWQGHVGLLSTRRKFRFHVGCANCICIYSQWYLYTESNVWQIYPRVLQYHPYPIAQFAYSSSSLLTTWVQTNKHIMVQSHDKNDNTKCWINDKIYVNVRMNWEKYNTEHKENTLRGNSISCESPHRKTPRSPEGTSLGVETFACIIMKFGRRLGNSATEASAKFHST